MKNLDFRQRLAHLRELHYRLSKEWLRVEQVYAIVRCVQDPLLLEIPTGEGKSIVLQLAAMLLALDGKKVDIFTHSEAFMDNAYNAAQKMSHYLGLSIAKSTESESSIDAADIFISDASSQIHRERRRTLDNISLRQSTHVLLDEFDNIAIDLEAHTTHQLSEVRHRDPALEKFLEILVKSENKISQENIPEEIKKNLYFKDFDYWKKALERSKNLKEKVDYVLEPFGDAESRIYRVYIVHRSTTGRVDKKSIWGEGVHHVVVARARLAHPEFNIEMPPISSVLAVGTLKRALVPYQHRVGVTGTTGTEKEQAFLCEVLGLKEIKKALKIPHAWRLLKQDDGLWPKFEGNEYYSRLYVFQDRRVCNRVEHAAATLDVVRRIQAMNKSLVVFMETIRDCEDFRRFLLHNKIASEDIQILDDTHDETSGAAALRPSEAIVVQRAKDPKRITLVTDAGGRGTDFDKVLFALDLKPSSDRRQRQRKGRVGRNGELGLAFSIFYDRQRGEEGEALLEAARAHRNAREDSGSCSARQAP